MQIKSHFYFRVNSAKKSAGHFLENVRIFFPAISKKTAIFPDIPSFFEDQRILILNLQSLNSQTKNSITVSRL